MADDGQDAEMKDVESYTCDRCSRVFGACSKKHYKQHVKSCGSGTFQCEECDQNFISAHTLRLHTKLHRNQRDFPCTSCERKFLTKYARDIHLKTHIDISYREYDRVKCNFCDKTFQWKSSLRRHMGCHQMSGLYKCPCGATFDEYTKSRYHKRKCPKAIDKQAQTPPSVKNKPLETSGDESGILHKCQFCQKGFKNRATFEQHVDVCDPLYPGFEFNDRNVPEEIVKMNEEHENLTADKDDKTGIKLIECLNQSLDTPTETDAEVDNENNEVEPEHNMENQLEDNEFEEDKETMAEDDEKEGNVFENDLVTEDTIDDIDEINDMKEKEDDEYQEMAQGDDQHSEKGQNAQPPQIRIKLVDTKAKPKITKDIKREIEGETIEKASSVDKPSVTRSGRKIKKRKFPGFTSYIDPDDIKVEVESTEEEGEVTDRENNGKSSHSSPKKRRKAIKSSKVKGGNVEVSGDDIVDNPDKNKSGAMKGRKVKGTESHSIKSAKKKGRSKSGKLSMDGTTVDTDAEISEYEEIKADGTKSVGDRSKRGRVMSEIDNAAEDEFNDGKNTEVIGQRLRRRKVEFETEIDESEEVEDEIDEIKEELDDDLSDMDYQDETNELEDILYDEDDTDFDVGVVTKGQAKRKKNYVKSKQTRHDENNWTKIKFRCTTKNCDSCVKGLHEMVKHKQQVHKQKLSFLCLCCSKTYISRSSCHDHIRMTHSNLDKVPLHIIGAVLVEDGLEVHMCTKCKFMCNGCSKGKETTCTHNCSHHGLVYYCPFCVIDDEATDKTKGQFRVYEECKQHIETEHEGYVDYIASYEDKYKSLKTSERDPAMFVKEGDTECSKCQLQCESSDQLKQHVNDKHATHLFCCGLCRQAYGRKSSLNRHIDSHNPRVKCDVCDKRLRDKQELITHMVTHTGEKLVCYICANRYACKSTLRRHMLLSHGIGKDGRKESQYMCDHCGKVFRNASVLRSHIHTHNADEKETCAGCLAVVRKENMAKHLLKCPKRREAKLDKVLVPTNLADKKSVYQALISIEANHPTGKNFKCNLCKDRFRVRRFLVKHINRCHTLADHRKIVCEICNKGFTRGYAFKIHMRHHFGLKPYRCRICHKMYRQIGHVREHLRSHGEVVFRCHYCLMMFKKRHTLGVHVLRHCKTLPFTCLVKKCTQAFKTIDLMLQHFTICCEKSWDSLEYSCNICGGSLSNAEEAEVHAREHVTDGVKVYPCQKCPEMFPTYKQSYFHMVEKQHFEDEAGSDELGAFVQNFKVEDVKWDSCPERLLEQYDYLPEADYIDDTTASGVKAVPKTDEAVENQLVDQEKLTNDQAIRDESNNLYHLATHLSNIGYGVVAESKAENKDDDIIETVLEEYTNVQVELQETADRTVLQGGSELDIETDYSYLKDDGTVDIDSEASNVDPETPNKSQTDGKFDNTTEPANMHSYSIVQNKPPNTQGNSGALGENVNTFGRNALEDNRADGNIAETIIKVSDHRVDGNIADNIEANESLVETVIKVSDPSDGNAADITKDIIDSKPVEDGKTDQQEEAIFCISVPDQNKSMRTVWMDSAGNQILFLDENGEHISLDNHIDIGGSGTVLSKNEVNPETATGTNEIQIETERAESNENAQELIIVDENLVHFNEDDKTLLNTYKPFTDTPFSCDICHKSFSKLKFLNVHKKTHLSSLERKYKCSECDMAFNLPSQLQVHERKHSGERPYKCEECDKTFKQRGHLKTHIQMHEGDARYVCSYCYKRFITRSQLKIHMNKFHEEVNQHECGQCGGRFLTSVDLTNHKLSHLSDETQSDLLKEFSVSSISADHFKSTPKTREAKSEEGKQPGVVCYVCGCLVNKGNLKRHLLQHEAKDKNFQRCDFCTQYFPTESELNEHIQEKHSDSTQCHKCGLQFPSHIKLSKHMKKEHVEREIECTRCHKKFVTKEAFINHCRLCFGDEFKSKLQDVIVGAFGIFPPDDSN